MKKRRRTFAITTFLAVSLTSALVLSGCASAADSGGGGGKTTISFWEYYGERSDKLHGKPLYDLIDRFMDKNPKIKVDVRFVPSGDFNRLLLQAAASKSLPTVALIDSNDTALFANSGIAQDLSERADKWEQKEAYYPAAWQTTQVGGKTYALPAIGDTYGLYYNTTLLKKAGRTPPATWDELHTTAKALATDGRTGLAMAGMTGAVDGIYPTLMRYLAESTDVTHVDTPAGRTALDSIKELVNLGVVSKGMFTWTEDNVYSQFTTGASAMMINSAGYVTSLTRDFPKLNWDVAPMPAGSSKGLTYLQSENLIVGATASDQQTAAAWKLLTFMQEPDQLAKYLPARSKLSLRTDVDVANPMSKKFASFLASAWVPEGKAREDWAEISSFYQVAMQSVASGSRSTDDALATFQKSIDGALAK